MTQQPVDTAETCISVAVVVKLAVLHHQEARQQY